MSPQPTPLVLGAPGIYQMPETPIHALTGVRMDVCAFIGVAPRGPARVPVFAEEWAPRPCGFDQSHAPGVQLAVPVPVESWSAYERTFGAFEGPGLLPYAVASFFDNGGRRAYIVRIVHQYFKADGITPDEAENVAGVTRLEFSGLTTAAGDPIGVRVRNEGRWGDRLNATLTFVPRILALGAGDLFIDRIRLPMGIAIDRGATLRLLLGVGARAVRRVMTIREDWSAVTNSRERWAWFDAPVAVIPLAVEIVEASLFIDDGAGRTETHDRIGLTSIHPRWLAAVLVRDSELLYPCHPPDDGLARWLDSELAVDAALTPAMTRLVHSGKDRDADIIPDDFFDPNWVIGNECPGCGIHSLVDLEDLSLLVAPDLYSPGPIAPLEQIISAPFAGPDFAECVDVPLARQGPPTPSLTGLQLDPSIDLDAIARLQQRMVDLADRLESFIVLLDVPAGLSRNRVLYWRAKFDSPYVAAYHPWLLVARTDDARDAKLRVNPSAFAAGIIAQREAQFGVPYGPANVIAAGAIAVDEVVDRTRHDELHQNAINVFVPERDGVRLTAGRTLSLDASWRQLNVRRLLTMIRRSLDQQMQWTVFEPNNRGLRFQISRALEAFLRQLYRANAFVGATEDEAFFVKCDDALNPREVQDTGQLIAQVGVAPAKPLEFIVLNLARDGDSFVIAEAG